MRTANRRKTEEGMRKADTGICFVMSGTGILYVEGNFVELEGLRNDCIAGPVSGMTEHTERLAF